MYDTDYIAANSALGRLLVRYRSTTHGDWRGLRELLPRPAPSAGTVEYALGEVSPPLAFRISPAAERGVGGLRALNDGLVPGAQASAAAVPNFVWTTEPNEPGGGGPGVAGTRRWVPYTFSTEEEVGRIDVFGIDPRDGVRVRFHIVRGEQRVHVVLDRDGFAAGRPIVVEDDVSHLAFTIETVDGRKIAGVRGGAADQRVTLPVGAAPATAVTFSRRDSNRRGA